MSICDPGTREGLIANLEETDSVLEKLRGISDAEYEQLELIPDFED